MAADKKSIIIAEDHTILREGLRALTALAIEKGLVSKE